MCTNFFQIVIKGEIGCFIAISSCADHSRLGCWELSRTIVAPDLKRGVTGTRRPDIPWHGVSSLRVELYLWVIGR